MKLPDKVYDKLKWGCLVFLPALGTAYSSLAGIWGFPCAEQVAATVVVVELFVGSILGISTAEYRKTHPLPPEE